MNSPILGMAVFRVPFSLHLTLTVGAVLKTGKAQTVWILQLAIRYSSTQLLRNFKCRLVFDQHSSAVGHSY